MRIGQKGFTLVEIIVSLEDLSVLLSLQVIIPICAEARN